MNYTQTAKHVFRISEKTGRTVFDLVMDGGLCHYEGEEREKIAAVLTDAQVQEICDTLIEYGNEYNEKYIDAKKKHPLLAEHYAKKCEAFFHHAAMWAITKPI